MNRAEEQAQAEAEPERRIREEITAPNEELLPPDHFSDEYWPPDPEIDSERGPNSRTITGLLARSCCGWRRAPDANEFFTAMREDKPTVRQQEIAGVLLDEGSTDEMQRAFFEGAFTWRQLVRMMNHRGGTHEATAWYVNKWTADNIKRMRKLLNVQ